MAAATRSGRFGEYHYRCACIAQLAEQLTLKERTLVDTCGRPSTDSNKLLPDTDAAFEHIDVDRTEDLVPARQTWQFPGYIRICGDDPFGVFP